MLIEQLTPTDQPSSCRKIEDRSRSLLPGQFTGLPGALSGLANIRFSAHLGQQHHLHGRVKSF